MILSACGPAARAARMVPDPILVQLEQGYGVVAAEVVKAERIGQEDRLPTRYAVTFAVTEVLADSQAGLGLKGGDALAVELAVGYAAEVEDWGTPGEGGGKDADRAGGPFATGAKFYLTIRKNETGRFEHARGASAARNVEQFDPNGTRLVGRLRQLADLPKERRAEAALKVVADPREAERLRMEAVAALNYWVGHSQAERVNREEILKRMEAIWNDPKAAMSTDLVMASDYLLRGNTTSWEKSDARRRVLLERVFAPFPEEPGARQSAVQARERVVWFLGDYLKHRPEEAAAVIIPKLTDEKWPAHFRWRLARTLQYAYQSADVERGEWAQALQAYYPKAVDAADPWLLRLLAASVESGTKLEGKRRFMVGRETREALTRAGERAKRIAEEPGADPNAVTAVHDVERALKALGGQR